jgi:hypothetical protein
MGTYPLLNKQAVAAIAEYEGTAKAEGNIFIIDHSYILKGTLRPGETGD